MIQVHLTPFRVGLATFSYGVVIQFRRRAYVWGR